MSFQGDVAGIGLGELLQGLARGGRDGVLTLFGSECSCAIGLKMSRVYLVASPDETSEHWRERAQRAWCRNLDHGLESQRREIISRAARLEMLYQMLEADNLHFRFEPGTLPTKLGTNSAEGEISFQGEANGPTDEEMERAWGRAFTVEYLLLEHARFSDETSTGPAGSLRGHDVPRTLDNKCSDANARAFLDECDGNSTLLEISDRLGWTLTQGRHTAGGFLANGALRIAQPRELLVAAQYELEQRKAGRAAARIEGWILSSRPGPAPVEEANLLIAQWESNRLQPVLRKLSASCSRTLLRKLDRVDLDVRAARDRWSALQEIHRGDAIITLRTAISRFAAVSEPDARAFQELLQVARTFQQREQPARAAALLRLASSHKPARLQTRIELGKRMMDSDLVQEGLRWLLEVARELMALGEPEKAVVPLRSILRALPENNDANGLLIQARAMLVKRKRRRWQTACLSAMGVILASIGLISLHSARKTTQRIKEVEANLDRPEVALQILEEMFPNDTSERIGQLRNRIYLLHQEDQRRLFEDWAERFDIAEDMTRNGDPIRALELTLELPTAPESESAADSKRRRADLFGLIANRLIQESQNLDLPVDASERELQDEQRLLVVVKNAVARITPEYTSVSEINFLRTVESLRDTIDERAKNREIARARELERMRQKDHSTLLETARSHRKAGNLSLAIDAFQLLFERDTDLGSVKTLQAEYQELVREQEAKQTATQFAENGQHAEALRTLQEVPSMLSSPLPWHVDSRPANARVTLANGTVRTTPFVIKSAFGEEVQLTFSSKDCVPRTVLISNPEDITVDLYRAPERTWNGGHVVEASPVAVGDDHILCDRGGQVVRIDGSGEVIWKTQLETLGGIKRTPLFLPGRAGSLLVLSEDGDVWFLDSHDGSTVGPYKVDSPPVDGPSITRGGISVTYGDGRVALWNRDLTPSFYPLEGLNQDPNKDDSEGIERTATTVRLTRRSTLQRVLTSPWTEWTVEVTDREFLIRTDDGRGFSARCQGEWSFILWEQPKALAPNGRLWISDEDGVRSFLPKESNLTEIDPEASPRPASVLRVYPGTAGPKPSELGARSKGEGSSHTGKASNAGPRVGASASGSGR